ncbi:MAG: hypothetical protein ACFFG0_18210 [Candidatus Thorarchaeota archaeon]
MEIGVKLYLKPKMGIIPEVTKQNYESIAKQLREPITNSLDAKAQNVYITVQPDGKYTNLIFNTFVYYFILKNRLENLYLVLRPDPDPHFYL